MASLAVDGFVVVRQVIDGSALEVLRERFSQNARERPGARNFDLSRDIPPAISDGLTALANSLAGRPMRPARILFFDKTPASNWFVPWHQDRTVAVKQKYVLDGFGPWSVKEGVTHVEPPVAILQDMLTLRLFVDDCDAGNGPLEIACGSHRRGRLEGAEVKKVATDSEIFVATGRAGDVLAMSLLAVHCSKRSVSPAHRRVLHIDYAAHDLPAPLAWAVS